MAKLGKHIRQLLLIRAFRVLVGKSRFFYYTKVRGSVRTLQSQDAIKETVRHNLKAVGAFGLTRMDKLIKPLSVLENVAPDSKILVIGPRNEDDILNLIGNGFSSKNIVGLDLISYSPFIDVGDMHHTNYSDSHFDVIICGWTLSYSNQPVRFAAELMRIIRDKGVIGIGVEYSTLTRQQSRSIHGEYDLHTDFERINSTRQIHHLFEKNIDHVYFNHDAPNKISHGEQAVNNVSNVVTIFSVRK